MTGSQNTPDDLSQEMKEMVICKAKSPSPDPAKNGAKSPNFVKRKLLDEIRNSPSAAARLRAIRMLKERNEKPNEPDLYRDELDLVTNEEREQAQREVTLSELFKDICLFVDVRTGEDNRSRGVQDHLRSRGISVTTDLASATHIIFKDGLKSTFEKGKELNLPFVSLLWIDDCKKYKALVDYKNYPVIGIEKYEDPIRLKRIKRKRSMQPAAEFVPRTPKRKRRVRAKVVVEKPLIEINCNKGVTPVKASDCTMRTPKTIEVTVKAKSHARVEVKQRNRKTVVYSSDEMEVSETKHEIINVGTPVVRSKDRTKKRTTRNSSRNIVIETESPAAPLQGPVNSTRFSAVQGAPLQFGADDISSIISVEDPCTNTPSPIPNPMKETPKSTKEIPTIVNEETKHVRKPLRKRKLFNPNLTPQEEKHNETEVPLIPPTPTLTDDPSPIQLTKKGSDECFEKILKKTQDPSSTANPTSQAPFNKDRSLRVFVGTGLNKEGRVLLKTCVKQLSSSRTKGKTEIQAFVDKRATHLIMQEPYSKTQKLLLAILRGIWILNENYLKDCLEKKAWLPEEFYEVKDFLPGIFLSRAEHEIFGPTYKMRLFSGTKFFVCPDLSAGAQEIIEFIELGDGKIVKTPEDANYQIRDELNEHFSPEKQVSSQWITDSIGAGQCKNVKNYLLMRRICSQSAETQVE